MSLFSLVVVEVFTFFISELFKSSVRCCTHATKLSGLAVVILDTNSIHSFAMSLALH